MQRIIRSLLWRQRDAWPPVAVADVAKFISDPEQAQAAYKDLHHLEELHLAKVYTPACADFWVVYLESRLTAPRAPHGERITLEEWCQRWLAREDDWRQWVAEMLAASDEQEGGVE